MHPKRGFERRPYETRQYQFNSDSSYFDVFTYYINNDLLETRRRRNFIGQDPLPYIDEKVQYTYDSINRITREEYEFYIWDGDPAMRKLPFGNSHTYHDVLIYKESKMYKDFTYDEMGNIKLVKMLLMVCTLMASTIFMKMASL